MCYLSSKEIKAILKTADKPDVAEIINEAAEKKIRIETSNPYVGIDDQSFTEMQLKVVEELERAQKEAKEKAEEEARKKAAQEEWIWITGYKGTNKDMTCRNTQYEMGKQFSMPKDTVIKDCSRGYHLCKDLKDVYNYYHIGDGNRFFEVKALVRRYNKNGTYTYEHLHDKMTSKSITFVRELTADEIFEAKMINDAEIKAWTTEQKELALQTSIHHVVNQTKIKKLVELGYSEVFATWVVNRNEYDLARTMGLTPGVSMDVKVLTVAMAVFE